MREFRIGERDVGDQSASYLICDISHNHLGHPALCREMVRVAAEAGADAVKLQRRGSSTYSGLRGVGEGEYAALREARELEETIYQDLGEYAHSCGVHFLATAFDPESADMLARVGVDAFKLASGDITNLPLIQYVAKMGKPMILSTGGCQMADVRMAHQALTAAGVPFALLHCTSEYPVSMGNVNLRLIDTYRRAFADTVIGFSSHVHRDCGAALEAAAFALGARIFEKHFTLTPGIGSGEHAFGLDGAGLKELVATLARAKAALGDGQKRIMPGEEMGILRLGKHLTYARTMQPECAVLQPTDFAVVGGGRGVLPYRLGELVGGRLRRPVQAGEDVQADDILLERAEVAWPHECAT